LLSSSAVPFSGILLRRILPPTHLTDETKGVVILATGVVGTLTALVLGLLIAAANNSFNTKDAEIISMAADVIQIDHLFAALWSGGRRPARFEFGLFAPPNGTTVTAFFLCALAAAGAIEMTLDLNAPFRGLIRISNKPMKEALDEISRR
jgi:hypothetical protein